MSKEEAVTVKDAVHKLQLYLLEGIEDEDKLFAAGSILSQGDYHDIVTERSIANMCGYPLCRNTLPSDRPRKGRYRISLKEHKVYDLQETYMYCSTSCVVNSLAFAGSIQEERSAELKPTKLNEVLGMFAKLSLTDPKDDHGKNRKFGLSELRVKEKTDVKAGEVSMEEWAGPSNAVEGYVPLRDQHVKPAKQNKSEKGKKPKHQRLINQSPAIFNEMDFTSTIITQDEYSISKGPGVTKSASDDNTKNSEEILSDQPVLSKRSRVLKKYEESDIPAKNGFSNQVLNDLSNKMNDNLKISDPSSASSPSNCNDTRPDSEINDKNPSRSVANGVKSSLKHSNEKNVTRSVSWADAKNDGSSNQTLCTFNESVDSIENSCKNSGLEDMEADGRYASAEACALALALAADAVSSGGSDVSDAVAEAGIIIMPPDEVDESEILEEDDLLHAEQVPLKWPSRPGLPDHNVLDSNDTWYDSPPEGFNLTLSPFATMFTSLFAWISSNSLAYIYGHDESLSEDYSCINGREYPGKVVLSDGRSSEIRQALALCLSQSLPGIIADLRLPVPISTMEKELDHLLDTMTFTDALPPFRMKQWQLVVLFFLDALSVCRIPTLSRYMTGRRTWLPKILEGARISAEEHEIIKDLIIPLGRVPRLASQSGG